MKSEALTVILCASFRSWRNDFVYSILLEIGKYQLRNFVYNRLIHPTLKYFALIYRKILYNVIHQGIDTLAIWLSYCGSWRELNSAQRNSIVREQELARCHWGSSWMMSQINLNVTYILKWAKKHQDRKWFSGIFGEVVSITQGLHKAEQSKWWHKVQGESKSSNKFNQGSELKWHKVIKL